MVRFTRRSRAGWPPSIGLHNYISTLTQLSRELFASSEGALIDQSFALTQGLALVVGGVGETARRCTTCSATSAAGRSSPAA